VIDATLANMRNSSDFFKTDEIIHIFDGRKKEDIGFFVPKVFEAEFQKFVEKIEKKKKHSLLQRVAKAQKKDPVAEGSISDGIK
jgi:hypothetical protein